MRTDWDLIKRTMNATIDACRQLEECQIADCELVQGKITVGDFMDRFGRYPQGAARDIVRLRSKLGNDQKTYGPLAKSLINTATACAEIIGLEEADLQREFGDHNPHCGTAGKTIAGHLAGIEHVYTHWIVPETRKTLDESRSDGTYNCEMEKCPSQPGCDTYNHLQKEGRV